MQICITHNGSLNTLNMHTNRICGYTCGYYFVQVCTNSTLYYTVYTPITLRLVTKQKKLNTIVTLTNLEILYEPH